ncbi:DUF550 domain-containing protein [Halomonas sp. SpR1]|uniref:dATP/dGTP pyrophosphohydrolase domain-containing protein n=1 Tax=Halomonas sp. SpR1 TaxID=3050462 RepID=UPI0027E5ABE5|nr:dATP/dGTP pyrophosphohydrolase domain-containing protein [Halomonas sp. SpR1]MDQ7734673.1 DUF550 domain-containing protein [Halomonas sp. SpR1]
MRVKIGDQWHDSSLEPICLQVSEHEQEQIGGMDRNRAPNGKYAVFPDNWKAEKCFEWMNAGEEFGGKNVNLANLVKRQMEFSSERFGPGARLKGIIDHIRKELIEVEQSGGELEEWVDVVLLALDGAWRAGNNPYQVAGAVHQKIEKNIKRSWPDWLKADTDKAIEHVKEDGVDDA